MTARSLEVVIPGDPVAKGRPRFGRGRTYTPAATLKAEGAMRRALQAAVLEHCWGLPARGEVGVTLAFTLPLTQAQARRGVESADHTVRPDLDNLAKLVLDAANGLIWFDDCQITHLGVSKRRGTQPGVRLAVWAGPDPIVMLKPESPQPKAKLARKPAAP
jgi:Holliday junction resolvase RusA-like endonuclease